MSRQLLHLLLQLGNLFGVGLGFVWREDAAPILRPCTCYGKFTLRTLFPVKGIGDVVVFRLLALVSIR